MIFYERQERNLKTNEYADAILEHEECLLTQAQDIHASASAAFRVKVYIVVPHSSINNFFNSSILLVGLMEES